MNSTRLIATLGAGGVATASLLVLGAGPALAGSDNASTVTITVMTPSNQISSDKTVILDYHGASKQASMAVLLDGKKQLNVQTKALSSDKSGYSTEDTFTIPVGLTGHHLFTAEGKGEDGHTGSIDDTFNCGGGGTELPVGVGAGAVGVAGLLGVGLFAVNRRRRGALL